MRNNNAAVEQLDRWADDGGSQLNVLPIDDSLLKADAIEHRVFESLGVSVATIHGEFLFSNKLS